MRRTVLPLVLDRVAIPAALAMDVGVKAHDGRRRWAGPRLNSAGSRSKLMFKVYVGTLPASQVGQPRRRAQQGAAGAADAAARPLRRRPRRRLSRGPGEQQFRCPKWAIGADRPDGRADEGDRPGQDRQRRDDRLRRWGDPPGLCRQESLNAIRLSGMPARIPRWAAPDCLGFLAVSGQFVPSNDSQFNRTIRGLTVTTGKTAPVPARRRANCGMCRVCHDGCTEMVRAHCTQTCRSRGLPRRPHSGPGRRFNVTRPTISWLRRRRAGSASRCFRWQRRGA